MFIIVFAGLLASIPAGFQGPGQEATTLLPVDPNLLTDFSATMNWTKSAYSGYVYPYGPLGGEYWLSGSDGSTFVTVNRKILFLGVWFGGLQYCDFVLSNGTNRGQQLSMTEIAGDATDGVIRYDLKYTDSGNDAGGFVAYWNTTAYSDPADAMANNVLNFVHGVGIDKTASTNIFSLLLQLLFLQLPDVPALVNLILATPVWAAIVYLIWFIVKESLPFV